MRWVGQSIQAERGMCKKAFLGFPKQKMRKMKNQNMVRIKGGTPLREQQHGLDTATKRLTDLLLPCYWFCCLCFHKLGTKASSCQRTDILCQMSLWNRREFRWETSLVVDYLPLLAGFFTHLPLEWDLHQLWWIIIIFIGIFAWLSI